MESRIDFYQAAPEAIKALVALEGVLGKLGLNPALLDLIKLRASQINGCAFCVDLHSSDLKKKGETDRRIWAVAAWHETPFFSETERAALAWTESITLIAETHAPDADYEAARAHFSANDLANLTIAIGLINLWNRLGVGFRKGPKA